MLESRLSRALLILGAAVGMLSIGVWAVELQVNLPDWIVRVAMMKLALVASLGLLAAGALVGRHANARRSLPLESPPASLGEGAAEPLRQPADEAARNAIERRRSDTAP